MRKGRDSNPPMGCDHPDGVFRSSGMSRRGNLRFEGGVHGGRGCREAAVLNKREEKRGRRIIGIKRKNHGEGIKQIYTRRLRPSI